MRGSLTALLFAPQAESDRMTPPRIAAGSSVLFLAAAKVACCTFRNRRQ